MQTKIAARIIRTTSTLMFLKMDTVFRHFFLLTAIPPIVHPSVSLSYINDEKKLGKCRRSKKYLVRRNR